MNYRDKYPDINHLPGESRAQTRPKTASQILSFFAHSAFPLIFRLSSALYTFDPVSLRLDLCASKITVILVIPGGGKNTSVLSLSRIEGIHGSEAIFSRTCCRACTLAFLCTPARAIHQVRRSRVIEFAGSFPVIPGVTPRPCSTRERSRLPTFTRLLIRQ